MGFNAKTFAIVLDAIQDSAQLPDFADREAVKVWAGELAGDCVDLVKNLGGAEQAVAALTELAPTLNATYQEHLHTYCMAKGDAGKLGDGTLLKLLQNVNWAQLIQLITTFIAFFPKGTPAPADEKWPNVAAQ
jgi:hypothetical protein